jgi:GT2 family glycosyltransferase
MGERPDLSVLMVTHGRPELAVLALRSARERLGHASAQWLVVDSGSTDGTPDAVAAAFPDLEVERLPNVGFAAGNNHLLPRATGRYVLLLNPDMELVEGTLGDLVAALDARPEVGAASVLARWPDGRLQQTLRRFPSPARQLGEALFLPRLPGLAHLTEEERREALYARETSTDWLVGGFLVVRREAVEQAGGLDERFFLFSEETDWCYRLRRHGWDVRHLPVMTVYHHSGRMARPDLFAQNSFSKVLYARKHFSPPRRGAFRSALAARHALRVAALAPAAALRPRLRTRVEAERRALAVVLGLAPPPYRPAGRA